MKELTKNSSVNVVYLTTKCNFACSYCYEHLENKKEKKMTFAEIKNAVDNIIEAEPKNSQTLFVLFGGEATLAWNEAKFLMNYAMSKKSNVIFNLETNGFKFKSNKFISDFINTEAFKNGKLSLDISFDGVGNSERVLKSGKQTTKTLLEVFKKLNILKIPFRLRYTVHSKNFDFLEQDLQAISDFIHPQRIILSVAYNILKPDQTKKIPELYNNIIKKFQTKTIKIPVCEVVCNYCDGCKTRKEFKSYFSESGNINKTKTDLNAGLFDHFEEK